MPLPMLIRAAVRLSAVYSRRAMKVVESALHERLTPYERFLTLVNGALGSVGQANADTTVSGLRRHLRGLRTAVAQAVEPTWWHFQEEQARVPDLRTLLAELRQLDDEFGGLEVDLKAQTIRVTTERIVLEDVDLGTFAIELCWARLLREASGHCFAIEALEPCMASSGEDEVTHPHVRSGVLCAGDASVAVQHALHAGRLADAFCLVRSVLRDYNPASAYVALDVWHSGECAECTLRTPFDELSSRAGCGSEYCSDCIRSCSGCDACLCAGCQERCALCREWYCTACLQRCASSGKDCCRDCRRACATCGSNLAIDALDPVSG
ncbi:hypothetical protein AYO44_01410, partial [Planctomycetaceae bacterium SCGC AG-212-F19]